MTPGKDPEPRWFGHAGVDLRAEQQRRLVRELEGPEYQELFALLRSDPRLTSDRGGSSGIVENDYFPSPDAELYAAMILRSRPRRIVEVGSGFSTVVARHAIEYADLDCPLHVVDPRPRLDLRDVADRVDRRPVQETDVGLSLGSDTLLFIDATHKTEAGGDGPHLYCHLLPSLPRGVLIHVHDVYLPYDYPMVYVRWGYTEQYLLHALVADNDRLEVVVASYFLSRRYPDVMRAAFGPSMAAPGRYQGASFWMRTT